MGLNSFTGTWTPAATGISNYDGSFTVQYAMFIRVDNMVFFRIDCSIGATAGTTTTTIELTLPIASNMTITGHLGGGGINYNNTTLSASVVGNSTTDKMVVSFTSVATSGFNNFNLWGSYVIL
jgi:hypothetical protein